MSTRSKVETFHIYGRKLDIEASFNLARNRACVIFEIDDNGNSSYSGSKETNTP